MSEITNKRITELDEESKPENGDFLLLDNPTKGSRKVNFKNLVKSYELIYNDVLESESFTLFDLESNNFTFDNELKIFIEARLTETSGAKILTFYSGNTQTYTFNVPGETYLEICITLKKLNDTYVSVEFNGVIDDRSKLTTNAVDRLKFMSVGTKFMENSKVRIFNR